MRLERKLKMYNTTDAQLVCIAKQLQRIADALEDINERMENEQR